MKISSKAQKAIHALGIVLTPLAVWAKQHGYITDQDMTLWATYVVGSSTLAFSTSVPLAVYESSAIKAVRGLLTPTSSAGLEPLADHAAAQLHDTGVTAESLIFGNPAETPKENN